MSEQAALLQVQVCHLTEEMIDHHLIIILPPDHRKWAMLHLTSERMTGMVPVALEVAIVVSIIILAEGPGIAMILQSLLADITISIFTIMIDHLSMKI